MSLLNVTNLSQQYGDKILYRDAQLQLYKKEHMGIVGQNGAGKSTLIGILTGEIAPDEGQITWQANSHIGHLDQYAKVEQDLTILEYLRTVFCEQYQLEKEIAKLYEQFATTGNERLLEKAARSQTLLEHEGFYEIERSIEKIYHGLGLSAIGVDRAICELSGGQRAKLILAKLLLEHPDVLLLDEPTNFLDKEHVQWLASYLTNMEHAYIVVSHDAAFLDQITTCICDIEAGTIKKYHGSYKDFLKQKAFHQEDHLRRYTAQQKMIKRTEDFIRKNIAGTNSKNAKGRRKQLAHVERIIAPTHAKQTSIRFQEASSLAQCILEVKDLCIGYQYPLLKTIQMRIQAKEKVVITGFNGIGKTTFLRTLMEEIRPLSGCFTFAKQARIGYYEQDLKWTDGSMNPKQIIREDAPHLSDKQIYERLADCGVRKDMVLQSIHTLSGGEQSKVKLCKLLLHKYNVLLMDEPTNHLDQGTKDDLKKGLQSFDGTILLVTHELQFYEGWIDRIIHIEDCLYEGEHEHE